MHCVPQFPKVQLKMCSENREKKKPVKKTKTQKERLNETEKAVDVNREPQDVGRAESIEPHRTAVSENLGERLYPQEKGRRDARIRRKRERERKKRKRKEKKKGEKRKMRKILT